MMRSRSSGGRDGNCLKVEGLGRERRHGAGLRSGRECKNGKTIVGEKLREVKVAGMVGR